MAIFCNNFELLMALPHSDVVQHYIPYDMLVGSTVIVMPKKKEDTSANYNALVVGFDEQGQLLIKKENDETEIALLSEEVTIRLFEWRIK